MQELMKLKNNVNKLLSTLRQLLGLNVTLQAVLTSEALSACQDKSKHSILFGSTIAAEIVLRYKQQIPCTVYPIPRSQF